MSIAINTTRLAERYLNKLFICFSIVLLLSSNLAKGQSNSFSNLSLNGSWPSAVIDSLDAMQPNNIPHIKSSRRVYVIKVTDQKQFDKVNEALLDAIVSGYKNVKVIIGKGNYFFHEDHILINDLNAQDVSVTVEADRATILTSVEDLSAIKAEPWTELVVADSLIEVVDIEKKVCFIPFKNQYSDSYRKEITSVQVTQWYKSPVYDISTIDSTGIIFIASDLKHVDGFKREGYNVNYDNLYLNRLPRFRLYNSTNSYRCNASRLINIRNSSFKSLSICGVSVIGNKPGPALISIDNVKAGLLSIRKCKFCFIRSGVVSFNSTDNVLFEQNYVYNSSREEVQFTKGCKNVRVINNLFDCCGRSIENTFCVTCKEAEYYIADNVFKDFGYGAIGVGVWHGLEKRMLSRGIIEHNEIYYSKEYYANCLNHTLMDGGAIYVWTQNDGVIIRFNYIHDYAGAGDNRGVFCDDGASNVKIYKNVIINIPNSYSIDSRMVKDQKDGFVNNSNNFVAYNIVDNGIRFVGYKDENRHCLKGTNFLANTGSKGTKKYIYENLEISDDDIQLENEISFKRLKKNNVAHFVNKVIARSR